MNKAELIEAILVGSERLESKAAAEDALNTVLNIIQNALKPTKKNPDPDVQIIGFGTFKVKRRAKHKGMNPQTKEAIVIPAKNVVTFKPGKKLKESVN